MTNDIPDEPLEPGSVEASEAVTVEGHSLRGLSDAMNRVGDELMEQMLPWQADGDREAVIGTIGRLPVLVMDLTSGAISSIASVKAVLIEGQRYVVFGVNGVG